MILSQKHVKQVGLGLSALLVIMLLIACSGSGTTASGIPTSTPSPTSIPLLKTFTSTDIGFSIAYPQYWKVNDEGSTVVFTDASGVNTLTVTLGARQDVPLSTNAFLNVILASDNLYAFILNIHPASDVPATARVGGDTWDQRGITGTVNLNGQTVPGKGVLMADKHPNATILEMYAILYVGPTATFNQTNSTFQAMLQSFKFST